MSKRIEIRGVIVSADLDQNYFGDYIAKGIITPESRIRAQLAEASAAGEDVELYINSPGGSVFSGNEMINALKAFAGAGRKLDITVGAMAASMAANLIATAGAGKVRAFANSKIMYHSAYACMCGGPEGLRDEAGLLDSVNADVIAALTAKAPAKKAEIEAWFAEGRAGWLSAKQALEMGLVDEIIDEQDKPGAAISKEESDKILESGVDLAAFEFEEPKAPAAAATATVPLADFEALTRDHEALKARFAGLQSAKDKEIAGLKEAAAAAKTDFDSQMAKLRADLGTAQADLSAKAEELAKVNDALADNRKQLATSQDALAKLTGDVLASPDGYATFEQAVAALGYGEAAIKYPELLAAFKASQK